MALIVSSRVWPKTSLETMGSDAVPASMHEADDPGRMVEAARSGSADHSPDEDVLLPSPGTRASFCSAGGFRLLSHAAIPAKTKPPKTNITPIIDSPIRPMPSPWPSSPNAERGKTKGATVMAPPIALIAKPRPVPKLTPATNRASCLRRTACCPHRRLHECRRVSFVDLIRVNRHCNRLAVGRRPDHWHARPVWGGPAVARLGTFGVVSGHGFRVTNVAVLRRSCNVLMLSRWSSKIASKSPFRLEDGPSCFGGHYFGVVPKCPDSNERFAQLADEARYPRVRRV